MRNAIIILFVLCSCMLTTAFIISSNNNSNEEYVVSVKEGYSVVYEDNAIIEIPLFFTNENVFNNSQSISSVLISNENTKLTCELLELLEIGMARYEGVDYYQFSYKLLIPCKNDLRVDDAKIEIIANDKSISIEIGTVTLRHFEKLGDSKEITINSAQVLAKSNTIEGIIIGLESKIEGEVKIKNIEVDSNKIFVDLNNINPVYKSYSEKDSIVDVIEGYNLYTKQPIFSLEEFVLKDKVNVVLPIKYLDKLLFTSCPIIVEYEINGVSDTYVFDDIKYINHINQIIDIGGVVKCRL